MRQYNILIFPCGTEIANEIISALKYHKYFKILLASSEGVSYCNFRNRKVYFLPYVTEDSFVSDIKELVNNEDIDFVIPAHDDVAYFLSCIEEEVSSCKVIGQDRAVNEIVRFKDVTYDYFKGLVPVAEIYSNESDFKYPFFVKPKKGQGSKDCLLINNKKDFESFSSKFAIDEFVLMEYLEGDEFTVDCFSDNGFVLYVGGRTRERTVRGITSLSTFVSDLALNESFKKYAKVISKKLNLHGLWFYQMKLDRNGDLKLLEIGARVSGTMMLNRARGMNFVEIAIYQKLGFPVEIAYNEIGISLGRALEPKYLTTIEYKNLYIDFDDTLFIREKYINPELMKLIFVAKNENKKVYLITKNKKNNLTKALHMFGISSIFDDILHLKEADRKIDYMKCKSILIDDSFRERKEAIDNGFYALGVDNFSILFKD